MKGGFSEGLLYILLLKIQMLNTINELTKLDKKTLVERALKLTEEVGEVAESVLSYTNACGCGYKDKNKDDVIEECVDAIIVSLSIISQANDNNIPEDKIKSIFNEKLGKWKKTSLEK